jgi:hypothetical protein
MPYSLEAVSTNAIFASSENSRKPMPHFRSIRASGLSKTRIALLIFWVAGSSMAIEYIWGKK